MTVGDGPDPPAPPAPAPGPEAVTEGWLVALMAANTIAAVGLAGDIARHVSLAATLEGDDFLAGWHLVLYGGVAGVGLVLGLFALKFGPAALRTRLATATVGFGALCVGGVADAAWHEVFGIEAAFQALVSPPHLVIFMGLVLLMVAPIAALAEGRRGMLDPVASLVLALSVTSLLLVISLFTGYLTPLVGGSEFQAGAYYEPLIGTSVLDYDTSRGLGNALWFTALSSAVVVGVRARISPFVGTWTVAFGLLGVAPLVVSGLSTLPLTLGLVAFGVLSDLTGTRRRPHPLATGLAGAALWAVVFAAIGLRGELVWARELWSGVITTGFLAGAAVGAGARWLTVRPGPLGPGPPRRPTRGRGARRDVGRVTPEVGHARTATTTVGDGPWDSSTRRSRRPSRPRPS